MESTAESTTIRREIAIAAHPETVWELLVDPAKAITWMGTEASFDPRPGGHYRVEVMPGEIAAGEFIELDPPRRLVWSWGWEPGSTSAVASGSSVIEVELVPDGQGTTLHFLHRDLPGAGAAGKHAHGWDHYLERLARTAVTGDPGPDPWLAGAA